MKKIQSGVSLIEVLIAMAIILLIAVPVKNAISTAIKIWKTSVLELDSANELYHYIQPLISEMKYINTVQLLSNESNNAYIQYQNINGNIVLIFFNSVNNQALLSVENSYPLNSILMVINQNVEDAYEIISNVTSFDIIGFKENFQSQIFITQNFQNDYSTLNSLRILISKDVNGQLKYFEKDLFLEREALENSDFVDFGSQSNPFSNLEEQGAGFNNLAIDFDENSDDYIYIANASETVKIMNSGQYFQTINDAILNSNPGDTVMVAAKPDGYEETIVIPENVSLLGGYDADTWQRDPNAYVTKIKARPGISNFFNLGGTVYLNHGAKIEGFYIDCQRLTYCVRAEETSDISIINNIVRNADYSIFLKNVSGKVVGNDVEANIHSLRFESCSNILTIRNKLFSSNLRYKDNVLIKESQDIEFKNNLVQKGFSALKVQNSALISIANNIFMDAQNFGVFMQNVFNSTFVNNAVFNNNVGVMVFTSPQANFSNADIKYNFFRNHIYGNTVFDDNSENLDASNIVQSYSNEEWETQNPLFERLDIFNLRNRSILVDSGSDMAIYNDGFNFNQQIAKGTVRNDIGLYGGPYAGRVGVGQTILFSPNDENIQLAIEQSFPGDFLFFAEGSYDIDAAIEVYPYQVFQGTTLGKTIFNQLHDGVLFSIAKRENANYKLEEIQIENLNIRSNGGTAFNITESQGASAESISIKKTVIKDAEVGVFVKNAKDILLQYNTFISTDYPVYVEDQFEPSVQFTHNIVNEAITGVVNLSLLTVTSSYSIFNDVQTNYSGEVVEQDNQFVFNADIFWNSLNEQYMLRPGSLGIDMDGLIDAGAYEYYVSEGIFTFPYFSSNLNRQYKSVSVNFIQTSSQESFLSTIELSVNAYSQRLTLNQKIEISQNIVTNNIILFPSNIISNSAQFKFYIRSYIFNQSPAVEKITVTW